MLYTRSGDKGKTNLWNKKILKSDLRVEAIGVLDELNAHIGLVRSMAQEREVQELLHTIQDTLHAVLAETSGAPDVQPLEEDKTTWLEEHTDILEREIEPLKKFVLPGGTSFAAQAEIARTVCRRAERVLVKLNEKTMLNPNLLTYSNRLSSFLFALARAANRRVNVTESSPTYQ